MKKLNQKKILWIVKEMNKGDGSVYRIVKIISITSRWAREIYNVQQVTGRFLFPMKPDRRLRPISDEERNLILEVSKEHPISGVVALEKILDSQGVHIPHNRIHRILKEEGLALDEPC